VQQVLDRLYPEPPMPLNHTDPFTLLCAVLLSAQTTDGKVNEVTTELFARAPTPRALAAMSHSDVLSIIRTVGLAPTKARHLIATAQQLCERFGGAVPRTMEELQTLPGVGRKTASVVMSGAFGVPAFPVDTHIHRLALRWRLSRSETNVERVEHDLRALWPPAAYGRLHLQFIYFGREYCQARNHMPSRCPVCSWADNPLPTSAPIAAARSKAHHAQQQQQRQRPQPASPDDIPQLLLESPRKLSKTSVLYGERVAELARGGAAARLIMSATV
ncbi:DNA glycosylase, partial [Tribonema minus]